MRIPQDLADVLVQDGFVKNSMLLLVTFDEEGSGFSEEDVDQGHVEEVFCGGDVGQLDLVPKEDVTHDEKVDVGPVGGNDNQGSEFLFVVVAEFEEGLSVDNYLFVNGFKNFVEEPGEESNGVHVVLRKHLKADVICGLVQFFFGFLVRDWFILQLEHSLLNQGLYGLFDCFSGEDVLLELDVVDPRHDLTLSEGPDHV